MRVSMRVDAIQGVGDQTDVRSSDDWFVITVTDANF